MPPKVVIVIGSGGMGLPIARRLGTARHIVLADFSSELLAHAASTLEDEGYNVTTCLVDVSDLASTSRLAQEAAAAGPIEAIVHTAGLGPTSGSSAGAVYAVNLVGTSNVIEAFLAVAQPGTSLVCVSSMAGHMGSGLPAELERHLATAPLAELMQHPALAVDESDSHGAARAYGMSKRGNLLRVQGAAAAWGKRGARVNSVSPGVISTREGRKEIAGPAGKFIAGSPMERVGTPQDIVNAVAFLTSAESSFITGTDILVDGGVVSSLRWKG